MPKRIRARKGIGVSFPVVSSPAATPEQSNVIGLRFTVKAQIRGEVDVDFSDVAPRKVALALATAVFDLSKFGGPWTSTHTIRASVRCLKQFCAYLDEVGFSGGVSDLLPSHLEGFEENLSQKTARNGPRQVISKLVVALRVLGDNSNFATSPALEDRLRYISVALPPRASNPRDAYSDFVAQQLREAAARDIAMLARQVREDVCQPANAEERALVDRVREKIREHGLVRYDDPDYAALFWKLFHRGEDTAGLLDRFHKESFLFSDEIVPFLVYISLQSGMEIECCKWLQSDCFVFSRKSYSRITYWKGRAKGSERKWKLVRDGGLNTVGGVIRCLLSLTEHARQHAKSKYAVCYFNQGRIWEGYRQATSSVATWVARHDIRGDDGKLLHLQMSRLRKTYKSAKYRKAGGDLAAFVDGHGVEVAVNNYAEIPSHKPLHEQTIADALGDALRDATAEVIVVEPGQQPEATSWLAGCAGFTSGSHSAAGRPCELPFWGCLNCKNARYSDGHLPAIIAFDEFLIEKRTGMSAADWLASFGAAHLRIARQILPKFSDSAVTEARKIAESYALYLPAEAHQ